jgi:rhamnose utilization protein RhaD (predicted bifunctional aldolase and dehydrogenase)
LSERQLSLDELSRRVEEINAENGHALADNESAHRQYDYYLQQVHEANQQLAEIQRTTTPGAIEQRRERIASLKAQLKTELDALLR